ncbi:MULTISPECIES: 3-methyl-2-oxobutanoate hydroxymethyltransferase [Paraliobacillus]|uniref:3-methyl-2-oxobutanoate hydroxymethyltransferase n=1 Tax=Paraliobacillus TaxID=200903 RepID=UPI0021031C64|nr:MULTISPECIES: 3-methyl-2-oxobutanoate hydroxymethyltransferase [Paraliobacillus]
MKTSRTFQTMKHENEKIAMVTAYDYPAAKLAQQANVDMILVGDSLGMVVLGYNSTIQVTVDDMIHHAKAVTRAANDTYVVVDMPFMSYHISLEDGLKNAKRIFQETNAQSLKIEGASPEILTLVTHLTNAGIPVVAHIGLTPQTVNVLGGYRVQGKDQASAEKIIADAKALQASGAIALVLECVPKEVTKIITNQLEIPTIGIGAGSSCDGQVLVYHDLIQYGDNHLPKFVKTYENVTEPIFKALSTYVEEVKTASFPEEKHSYTINADTILPEE